MYDRKGAGTGTVRTRMQGEKRLLEESAVWNPEYGPMCEEENVVCFLFFFGFFLETEINDDVC